MCKKNATSMLSIKFELIAIDDSVMKILMECVTAQRAAAPLNKNESRKKCRGATNHIYFTC